MACLPPYNRVEVVVKARPRESWSRRLLNAFAWARLPLVGAPLDSTLAEEPTIMMPIAFPDREPGWRDLLTGGATAQVAWTLVGGLRDGESFDVRAKVRSTLGEDVWLWFEQDLPAHLVPPSGQAVVLRISRPDGLRLIPARVIEDSRGGSLLVAISGRVVRLQRRDHVRAHVALPPVSAVRLAPNGAALGMLGVQLIDVSGGGVQIASTEPLGRDERLRLNLRVDDGPAIPSIVAIVDSDARDLLGPVRAHACFGELAERERTRIIQFVYRQELAARRRAEGTSGE